MSNYSEYVKQKAREEGLNAGRDEGEAIAFVQLMDRNNMSEEEAIALMGYNDVMILPLYRQLISERERRCERSSKYVQRD